MPEGLPKQLGDQRLRDVLTFLLMAHPPDLAPAKIVRLDAPPPRRRAEVDGVLKASEPLEHRPQRPLRIVLVYGDQDHGPNEHDYPQWQERWMKLLSLAEGVRVTTAFNWPSPDDWQLADVIVWYCANPQWKADKGPELDAFLAKGGGLVILHFATNGAAAPEALAERIGLAAQIGKTAYRHGPLDVSFVQPAEHPIARGFDQVHFVDESYWKMIGDPTQINLLATCVEEGQTWPLLWTVERGGGRVFASIVGHYSWTFDDPLFRILVLRGIAWTAGEPIHRFHDLATIGARVEDRPLLDQDGPPAHHLDVPGTQNRLVQLLERTDVQGQRNLPEAGGARRRPAAERGGRRRRGSAAPASASSRPTRPATTSRPPRAPARGRSARTWRRPSPSPPGKPPPRPSRRP